MKKVSPVIQRWIGPYLPSEHFVITPEKTPKSLYKITRLYLRTWIVHPVKRHLTHYRSPMLTRNGTRVVGITGSAGKTTVKYMIVSVLSQKFRTVFNPANIDPVYSIPSTVLKTPRDTEKIVLEMGIEFPGEMNFYLWLVKPDIGILMNVDWTHTEFFGDLDGVLKEKQKLIAALPKDGYAILNYDDEQVRSVANKTKANVLFFGSSSKSDVQFKDVRLTKDFKTEFEIHYKKDSIKVKLPLLGYHFASLASAAAVVGIVSGIKLSEIKTGLESMQNELHRMQPITLKNDVILLDDTYNANPFATKGALKILKGVAGKRRKVFVFGEMKELGVYAVKGHREVGRSAVNADASVLLTLGELTKHTIQSAIKSGLDKKNTYQAFDKGDLLRELKKRMKKGDVILVKASRSMGLEEIVNALK